MAKITTIILSAIITTVLVFIFIAPKYQEFRDLTLKIREKEAELAFKEKYFQEIRETAKELEQYDEEIKKIDSAIPIRHFFPSLFAFISETSKNSALILKQIDGFEIASSKDKSHIQEGTIEATFIGPYEGIKRFLSTLETSSRIVGVNSIAFSEPGREETEGIFEFSLKLKTYSY